MCLAAIGAARAEQPLSKDDVTLLLLGGSPAERVVALVQQRAVDFQLDSELAKRFRDLGATEALIEAITQAGAKPKPAAPSAPATDSAGPPAPAGAVVPTPAPPSQAPKSAVPPQAVSPPAASQSKTSLHADLSAPSPERIREIIREFARKEKLFRDARSAYAYRQINTVQDLDVDGKVVGTFEQEWEVHYDDNGKRVEKVAYAPAPTLQGFLISARDLDAMRNIQPFTVTTDELSDCEVKYLGHLKLDQVAVYSFSVRPTEPKQGRTYFEGTVWVDDRELQVVKAEGRMVPQAQSPKGQPTLFRRCTTVREQIDGKFWFPTTIVADETLDFPKGPARVRQTIQYADYKQFKAYAATVTPTQSATASRSPAPDNAKKTSALETPSPDRIQGIIQEFARKEKLFKDARNTYAYHQLNKVQQLNVDGNVVGSFEQDWDILYDDSGQRIEKVTYSPLPTLKNISVTQEDLDSMRSVQPFVLTADDLPDYLVEYLDHVKLDEISAFVFRVRPKELKKGRLYFQGTVWVDDRDLQIVKSEGKTVPEGRPKKGQFNLFPRFTTYREQIDGKFWFPTYTMADDTLYFPSGPVRVKQIIRYTEYKQFKASSSFRIVPERPADEPKPPPKDAPPKE